jgi:DNA-binding response OmpR family regulator
MAHDQHIEPAVLIVEDNDAMANLMQRTLERDGWSVHRAANGKEAKDLIGRVAPPFLVTLDISLPDMSGTDLILHVKSTPGWERMPIVMVTGKPKDNAISWAVKTGTKAYLAKPFKPEELRDCVRRTAREPVASA